MTTALSIDDFPAFFEAVSGHPPFRWQIRLAREIAESRQWPDLLDLPTGSGKTATIDIALFLRALFDDQPRRIVFVVDRRVIVHQAFIRARRLRAALTTPMSPVVEAVRDRLVEVSFARLPVPLAVAELRGGIVRDETWAMRPDIPAVLVSTVDQVGSRLLFRGYGLSRGMRPVHAGLLGNDALFLLDEVHLARPFAATLADLGDHYRTLAELPDRWQVCELSATPAKIVARPFRLGTADREDAAIQRRCGAAKPVELRLVKVKGTDPESHRQQLVDKLVAAARELAEQPHVGRVGIVVNRVATAAAVERKLTSPDEHSTLLLTGRMRPFDREGVQQKLDTGGWLLGRNREAALADGPRFIVATQSIEAGADLDLDALVTECAPYDALVQRFGRLDRDGLLSEGGTPARGVVIATSAQTLPTADDPVYRSALSATWHWLKTREPLDFGIDARPRPSEDDEPALRVEPPRPPVLLPTHLDAWVQTAPAPAADPDPDLWLHGLRESPDLDVSVVWRADLGDQLERWEPLSDLIDWVSACPPTSGEAMPVPISALRRWLSGDRAAAGDVADIEGATAPATPPWRDKSPARILRWGMGDEAHLVSVDKVRPGDTVIVPSSLGGVSESGSWSPESTTPVSDLGTRSARRRNRLVLRLVPALFAGTPPPVPDPSVDDDEVEAADLEAVRHWLVSDAGGLSDGAQVPDDTVDAALEYLRAQVAQGRTDFKLRRLAHVEGLALVLEARWPGDGEELGETVDSEPETSEFLGHGKQVTLQTHLRDVEEWAGGLARACGLTDEIVDDLALAGRLHDVGKADVRFQRILTGGRAAAPVLLAKSSGPAPPPAVRRQIQRRVNYPARARHELLSASLLQTCPGALAEAHDSELVLHLVASHHGHARPGVPVAEDGMPVEVNVPSEVAGTALVGSSDHGLHRLDSGVADRFWALNERYGIYGLAWLESILRLADHRASAERQGER